MIQCLSVNEPTSVVSATQMSRGAESASHAVHMGLLEFERTSNKTKDFMDKSCIHNRK